MNLPKPVAPPLSNAAAPPPWWRFPMVWLVLSGPAAVVVASIFTATLAWKYIDPVISDEPAAARVQPPSRGPGAPAMLARNHAATPATATPATPATPATAPAEGR